MRPALTFTLLVATALAILPTGGMAEDGTGKTPPKPPADTAMKKGDAAGKDAKAAKTIEETPEEKAEKAEAQRIARMEREKEEERQRLERESQCVIKPVMTDAQIAQCKEVWR